MHLAWLWPPDDCLISEDLGGDAVWILGTALPVPGHLASVVDGGGLAVVAPKRGKRNHRALIPQEPAAYQAGTEAAKVLP